VPLSIRNRRTDRFCDWDSKFQQLKLTRYYGPADPMRPRAQSGPPPLHSLPKSRVCTFTSTPRRLEAIRACAARILCYLSHGLLKHALIYVNTAHHLLATITTLCMSLVIIKAATNLNIRHRGLHLLHIDYTQYLREPAELAAEVVVSCFGYHEIAARKLSVDRRVHRLSAQARIYLERPSGGFMAVLSMPTVPIRRLECRPHADCIALPR
jgi:hypothetical protein